MVWRACLTKDAAIASNHRHRRRRATAVSGHGAAASFRNARSILGWLPRAGAINMHRHPIGRRDALSCAVILASHRSRGRRYGRARPRGSAKSSYCFRASLAVEANRALHWCGAQRSSDRVPWLHASRRVTWSLRGAVDGRSRLGPGGSRAGCQVKAQRRSSSEAWILTAASCRGTIFVEAFAAVMIGRIGAY